MTNVSMPQLGETVADGTVTKWFKAVGEHVERGETLFEVSTDKVDTEIPSPASGTLTAILVAAGTTVDVGTVLATIGDAETSATVEPPTSSTPASSAPPSSAPPSSRGARATGAQRTTGLSPVVRRLLAEHQLEAADITATGPDGRLTRSDVLAYVAAGAATPAATSAPATSPVVRRLLAEHQLEATDVNATGPDGRLTRRDVEAAIAKRSSATGDEEIPFTKIRALTAEHMVRSKATSAHTLMVREVDYERVELVRRAWGPDFKRDEGFSLTYLPFNALAAVEALADFPHLNASVGDQRLIVHRERHLGIAVDLDGDGLVVPVVRGADRLGLVDMARAIRDLAQRARTKRLNPDEAAGGTFTITNPGPYGTLMTGAVINQPQVAILSTDGVARKPVVVRDASGGESIAIHSVGLLAITFDHRVIDGAYAARFLRRVDEILNTRDWREA